MYCRTNSCFQVHVFIYSTSYTRVTELNFKLYTQHTTTMHYSQIVGTTLALLASVSAVPTPGDLDGFVLNDDGWWPRANISNKYEVKYCPTWWANMEDESSCIVAYGEFDKKGYLEKDSPKPQCRNLKDVSPKSSFSPGTGLNCTLFARPDCDWGPMKDPKRTIGWAFTKRYYDVAMLITYPGRGNFGDADWIDRGFDSKEFIGKVPRSMQCEKLKKTNVL